MVMMIETRTSSTQAEPTWLNRCSSRSHWSEIYPSSDFIIRHGSTQIHSLEILLPSLTHRAKQHKNQQPQFPEETTQLRHHNFFNFLNLQRDGCYRRCCPKWAGVFFHVWREEEPSLVGNRSQQNRKFSSWYKEVGGGSRRSTKKVMDPRRQGWRQPG